VGTFGALATVVGFTPIASASVPKTTTLSTVPSISVFAGNGTNAKATPGAARNSAIGTVDSAIAVDRFGNTYLCDDYNRYIYKVTPTGTLSIIAGNGTQVPPTPGPATHSSIGEPNGLAVDKAGNLYISDDYNYRVYKVTPGGTLSIFAGNGGADIVTTGPALMAPIGKLAGLAFDPSGNLYMAAYGNRQVYKVTPGGTLSVFAGIYGSSASPTPGPATHSPLGYPVAVASDLAGDVYIIGGDYLDKVTPGGTLSIFAGTGTAAVPTPGPATHSSIGDSANVAVDGYGNVFSVDDHNDLLYKITPSGTLSIYAGKQGDLGNATSGPASQSAIGLPEGIAIDPTSGYLYLSNDNPGSYYIYRITPVPGYWLAGADGYTSGVGGATIHNTLGAPASDPVVGVASDSAGYWLVSRNGTVWAYGDAGNFSDLPAKGVNVSDIVAIAPTADKRGYWLIGADGGEFAFGDATFHGSLPGLGVHVNNIVGMVANPNGSGYILVGSDGGVFVFGGSFHGSLPGIGVHVNNIVGILPTGGGAGYVLVGNDGGAFVFGHGSGYFGSLPGLGIHVSDVVGLALSPDQGGYWMAEANGTVHPFGDAPSLGTPAGSAAHQPVVGIGAS
jgi:hypothetical protein